MHLNNHHRGTLLRIFQHPVSHNIEWRAVQSLLDVLGSVEEDHDGKFTVVLGPEVDTFERPRKKDISVQQVVDLRRMLSNAGFRPAADEAHPGARED